MTHAVASSTNTITLQKEDQGIMSTSYKKKEGVKSSLKDGIHRKGAFYECHRKEITFYNFLHVS
jgi:hypothetical protein